MMPWYKSEADQQPGRAREALWPGAGDFLSAGAVDCLANGKTFYATRSNVTGYSVSLMGSDFSKAKLN
jgi:hypothetical protein